MARVEAERLSDQETTRVFAAATLREARRAEELLTVHGVDYVVSVEPIFRTLFGSPRNGAVFSVAASQAEYCGALLTRGGLGRGVLIEST
jgi:hypothetical protein